MSVVDSNADKESQEEIDVNASQNSCAVSAVLEMSSQHNAPGFYNGCTEAAI